MKTNVRGWRYISERGIPSGAVFKEVSLRLTISTKPSGKHHPMGLSATRQSFCLIKGLRYSRDRCGAEGHHFKMTNDPHIDKSDIGKPRASHSLSFAVRFWTRCKLPCPFFAHSAELIQSHQDPMSYSMLMGVLDDAGVHQGQ